MYAKWLAILFLVLSPMTAMAEQVVAGVGRLEVRIESREEMIREAEKAENLSTTLKRLQVRTSIDRKSGLRFNVMEFDGGIMKALGISSKARSDTEIYIRGPYVSGKLGVGFMIRF